MRHMLHHIIFTAGPFFFTSLGQNFVPGTLNSLPLLAFPDLLRLLMEGFVKVVNQTWPIITNDPAKFLARSGEVGRVGTFTAVLKVRGQLGLIGTLEGDVLPRVVDARLGEGRLEHPPTRRTRLGRDEEIVVVGMAVFAPELADNEEIGRSKGNLDSIPSIIAASERFGWGKGRVHEVVDCNVTDE